MASRRTWPELTAGRPRPGHPATKLARRDARRTADDTRGRPDQVRG